MKRYLFRTNGFTPPLNGGQKARLLFGCSEYTIHLFAVFGGRHVVGVLENTVKGDGIAHATLGGHGGDGVFGMFQQ